MTKLAAFEAVALSCWSSLRAGLSVGAISGQMTEFSATETVSASSALCTFRGGVGAVSSEVTGLAASVAVIASLTLALSLSAETGSSAALRAVSGEMVRLTAVEAVSSFYTCSSWNTLTSLGAIARHVSAFSASEAGVSRVNHPRHELEIIALSDIRRKVTKARKKNEQFDAGIEWNPNELC